MALDLSDSVVAAKSLLGYKLVHDSPEGMTSGIIVEAEAYSALDAASHSHRGRTPRNDVMFGPAGHLYVYFTYGMHHCVNIVTGEEGDGQGVLLRALEPVDGIELMQRRRNRPDLASLTNGPGKVAQAMGLGMAHRGMKLGGTLRLEPGITPEHITTTTRIGISKDAHRPWRFYIAGNPYVSKR